MQWGMAAEEIEANRLTALLLLLSSLYRRLQLNWETSGSAAQNGPAVEVDADQRGSLIPFQLKASVQANLMLLKL